MDDVLFTCSTGRQVKLRFEEKEDRVYADGEWFGATPPTDEELAEANAEISRLMEAPIVGVYDAGVGRGARARAIEAGRKFLKTGEMKS